MDKNESDLAAVHEAKVCTFPILYEFVEQQLYTLYPLIKTVFHLNLLENNPILSIEKRKVHLFMVKAKSFKRYGRELSFFHVLSLSISCCKVHAHTELDESIFFKTCQERRKGSLAGL